MDSELTDNRAIMVVPRRNLRHLDEALSLAETAGYKIVRVLRNRYDNVVKSGVLSEIASEAREKQLHTLIYYGELKPSSTFTIMKEAKLRVVDRVTLILEIFARHASSKEALLQIEAARIRHELPLIKEFIRRSKLGELPGFLGPGKYAIDEYYRHLTRRLARIRRELEGLRSLREARLKSRVREGLIHVSIVGYASAGKTSLFNLLTGSERPVGPEYFTTLHPKHSAAIGLNVNGRKVVVADTVGFIRDVPPEIVEAFHATIAEIRFSDLIIFVVDISESISDIAEKFRAGVETLARIGALGIPTVIAANKLDAEHSLDRKLNELEKLRDSMLNGSPIIPVSASKGYGIDRLKHAIQELLESKAGEA